MKKLSLALSLGAALLVLVSAPSTSAPSNSVAARDKQSILELPESDTVSLRYLYVWKGVIVGESNAVLEQQDTVWRMVFDFRTRGPLKWFSKGRHVISGVGRFQDDGSPLPGQYLSKGRWDGDDYLTDVTFDDASKATFVNVERPPKSEKKWPLEPVPDALQTGPDPATLIMIMLEGSWLSEDGLASSASFDGSRVVEHSLTCDDQSTLLKEKDRSIFAGPATECHYGFDILAGHLIETEKQKRKRLKQQAKTERKAARARARGEDTSPKIWFAALNGADMQIPVRAHVYSGWGTVKMFLADYGTDTDHPLISEALALPVKDSAQDSNLGEASVGAPAE